MDFNRKGETLWSEWDGNGYTQTLIGSIIFCTEGHISLSEGVIFSALASAVQREGVCDSISQASTAIQPFSTTMGFAGEVDGLEFSVCDKEGETFYGDIVDEIIPFTWVEVIP
jgi:hypothetical protein